MDMFKHLSEMEDGDPRIRYMAIVALDDMERLRNDIKIMTSRLDRAFTSTPSRDDKVTKYLTEREEVGYRTGFEKGYKAGEEDVKKYRKEIDTLRELVKTKDGQTMRLSEEVNRLQKTEAMWNGLQSGTHDAMVAEVNKLNKEIDIMRTGLECIAFSDDISVPKYVRQFAHVLLGNNDGWD